MAERRIVWGPDEATAKYRTGDTEGDTNFAVVEDTDGSTVLLEWDDTASPSEWVVRGPVNLNANDLDSVGTLDFTNTTEPQVTASEGTSYDIDVSTGNYHKVTLTGDVTFDITNADASDVNSVVLHLVQDATGSRTPSFTPTVVWDGGSAPSWSTAANAEDVVTLVHDQDGSQWLGFVGGLGMA